MAQGTLTERLVSASTAQVEGTPGLRSSAGRALFVYLPRALTAEVLEEALGARVGELFK